MYIVLLYFTIYKNVLHYIHIHTYFTIYIIIYTLGYKIAEYKRRIIIIIKQDSLAPRANLFEFIK